MDKWLAAQSQQSLTFIGVALVLSIVFIFLGIHIKHLDPLKKPSKFMIVVDFIYNFVNNLYMGMFRGHCKIMLPYATCLLILLLTCNFLPLFLPLDSPTTDYNIPLSLVVITFAFKYGFEFKNNGIKEFLKGFTEPVAVMLPMNLMDIVAKPLSMSMRLFGNILSGTLILMVFNSATGWVQNLIVMTPQSDGSPAFNLISAFLAVPFHGFFDIFCGGIQAFVFTLLTLVFSSLELNFDKMDKKLKEKEQKEIAKV
ncbi:MAG: F0F1 ATP synthase subunit A [Bacilli bacterium]|jgi:F-type H+-transporting ATPase subunit a|nr:F0F1 ATP synthase subunit A [Bacilli bacterium]